MVLKIFDSITKVKGKISPGASSRKGKGKLTMPSVSMRRSTRVFGAHVLRSGRRLWPESHDVSKILRTDHMKNQWAHLVEDSGGACTESRHANKNNSFNDVRIEESVPEIEVAVKNVDMMYGIVYERKRKRVESGKISDMEDRRFGKKFYRGQWRKNTGVASCETRCDSIRCGFRDLAIVVNGSPSDYGCWMTCLLATVLNYIARSRIEIWRVSKFLVSYPIFDVYSSRGVLFLQNSTTAKKPVICIISGSKSQTPLFSFNFSTIPYFFIYMQTCMHLRSLHLLPCFSLPHRPGNIYQKDDKVGDVTSDNIEEPQHYVQTPQHQNVIELEEPEVLSRRKEFSNSSLGVTRSSLRSFQSKNSRHIQKRRSSLRRKRGQQLSGLWAQKTMGALASDFVWIRQESLQSSSIAKHTKDQKFIFSQDIFTNGCSVNLLITEPSRCYKEEGATITLQSSPSKQWCLSITKEGVSKYSFSAEKVMRPCCTNRFSHKTIWTVNGGFKLEFLDRQDWLIFKELYRECYDRNMLSPAASVIPVPIVQEVLTPFSAGDKAYVRPDSYIKVIDDELKRALMKKSANYDMDSDDEAWLEKLNDEFSEGVEVFTRVTPESFELIVDALEKGAHCNPDENFEDFAVCDFCSHLERREVVEAVHSHWVKKRKQKRAALVKIFQLYQPRRIQVIPKSVVRKKRSFKRTASQAGRGKHRPIFHAIAAERVALEQQNNAHKLKEAKAAVSNFEGLAILKRQKAQMLMANADLATYRAITSLRIAEGVQAIGSQEQI